MKGEVGDMPSNVRQVLPRLRMIEALEGRTELTRVGPSWRHAISEPDTLESEPPPHDEEEASQALHDFRAEQERRRRNMFPVMFVMGCALGILIALVPNSRFFRSHVLRPVAPARVAAPAAPASPAPSKSAMSPIDLTAIPPAPTPPAVASATAPLAETKHARTRESSPRPSAPAPVARSSPHHAKSSAATEDDDVVKNAHAADDLAAAQLTDAL